MPKFGSVPPKPASSQPVQPKPVQQTPVKPAQTNPNSSPKSTSKPAGLARKSPGGAIPSSKPSATSSAPPVLAPQPPKSMPPKPQQGVQPVPTLKPPSSGTSLPPASSAVPLAAAAVVTASKLPSSQAIPGSLPNVPNSPLPSASAPPPPPPPPPPLSPPPLPKQPANNSAGNSKKTPQLAQVKKSPKKLIIIALAVLTLFGLIGILLKSTGGGSTSVSINSPNKGSSSSGSSSGSSGSSTSGGNSGSSSNSSGDTVKLSYWGLWEPTEVLEGVIADYEAEHPGINVDYRKQSHKDYRERLQTAIASGNGPDIFRFHASWTSMLSNELSPLPSSIMNPEEFQKTFYPVAVNQLQSQGQLMGIPLMYDGLALYYNKEVLKTANSQPPETWAELKSLADNLTVPSDKSKRSASNIERGGLAIGNASNVEHFSDIIALLILQNGGDPADPTSTEVSDALVFYTNFITADKVWSSSLPSSTVAFARGDAAMMIAPSWRVHEVKSINPQLDFGIAPIPKLGDSSITWATFWAEGVNSKSEFSDESWEFLSYLSSKEVLRKMYSDANQVRAFGELYPRIDMADELSSDELVSPFLADAPIADGWYLSSYTHDNGVNDQLIKYYEDAVTAMLGGYNLCLVSCLCGSSR